MPSESIFALHARNYNMNGVPVILVSKNGNAESSIPAQSEDEARLYCAMASHLWTDWRADAAAPDETFQAPDDMSDLEFELEADLAEKLKTLYDNTVSALKTDTELAGAAGRMEEDDLYRLFMEVVLYGAIQTGIHLEAEREAQKKSEN